MTDADEKDRFINRHALQNDMGVSGETMRRWIKSGKLPPPDVAITERSNGWRASTLRKFGINFGRERGIRSCR